MRIINNFEICTLHKGEIDWLLSEEIHELNDNIKMKDS